MIPWWSTVLMFVVGAFVGLLIAALMSADKDDRR